jgi:hypothetical protein
MNQHIFYIFIEAICHDDFKGCEWSGSKFNSVEMLFDGLVKGA